MARPTKYTPAIVEKANEYLLNYNKGTDDNYEPIPTIAGLSLALGIARDTVYDWAAQDEKGKFSDIVSDLMAKQEMRLMAGGIMGEFNASITKLALTKHGYSDKQDTNVSGQLDTQATYVPEVHRFDGSTDS